MNALSIKIVPSLPISWYHHASPVWIVLHNWCPVWLVKHSCLFFLQLKTWSVALALCLNIGVDPPDVVKTNPCARKECWIGECLGRMRDLIWLLLGCFVCCCQPLLFLKSHTPGRLAIGFVDWVKTCLFQPLIPGHLPQVCYPLACCPPSQVPLVIFPPVRGLQQHHHCCLRHRPYSEPEFFRPVHLPHLVLLFVTSSGCFCSRILVCNIQISKVFSFCTF